MKDEEIRKQDEGEQLSNAMKVIKGTGQSIEPEPSDVPVEKVGKFENFWYHHKWHAGVTIGVIVLAVILIVEIFTNKTPDVYMMYAGPGGMIGNQYDRFEEAVVSVMEDYDKNGYKKLSFSDNTYLTAEQIAARRKMGLNVDETANRAAFERYNVEIAAGEHMICLLDPQLYQTVADIGGFVPLKDIFGEKPGGAVDDYGIRIGDISFFGDNPDLSFIPADTIIALRVPSTLNLKSEEEKQEYFERHRELFISIVEYQIEK